MGNSHPLTGFRLSLFRFVPPLRHCGLDQSEKWEVRYVNTKYLGVDRVYTSQNDVYFEYFLLRPIHLLSRDLS